MDASQDGWDWEVLPDHGHGGKSVGDQETKEPNLPPSEDADVRKPVDECKDIGVVPVETKSSQEELMPKVTELLVSDGEDEHETFESSDDKEVDDDMVVVPEIAPHQFAEEEEIKKDRTRPECVVFSVGKLKVNGIGALCSFGVAAATVCIFLIGGRLQHQQKQQQQKIQLQFYGDDKRMQQVVQQTSRLNQATSSVMGGGSSTRANISFGGFYDGL